MSAPLKTAAAAACAAMTAMTAQARADVVDFDYHASELETAQGAADVYARLKKRAHSLCAATGPRPIAIKRWEAACAADLVEDFVAGIDDTQLTRIHAAGQDEQRHAAGDGPQVR